MFDQQEPSKGDIALRNQSSGELSFIEKKVHKLMRKHHLPACAITIVSDQEVLYQEAFGMIDMENHVKATTHSVFKLLSVAKVFTAIEVFREVEEGIINLENPITHYLPAFTIQSRFQDENPITVESILAHRAGLPRNKCVILPELEPDPQFLDKFETSVSDCHLAYPVGFRYKYSNLGYDLLGRIIEENRNQGFAPYMKAHLLHDLGMTSSTFQSVDIADPANLARGYEHFKGSYYPMIQSDINNLPSGNLYSTIEDLSVFLKAAFNNEVFENTGTMALMYQDLYSKRGDPETMGLGWKTARFKDSDLLVWHDGGPVEGIGALIAMLPDQNFGIAIVCNGTSFSSAVSLPFAIELISQILERTSPVKNQSPGQPPKKRIPEQLLVNYEGDYASFGQIMQLEAKRGKLKGRIGGIGLELVPLTETTFRVTHWMEKIGLTKIIKPPVEFNKIKIEFCNCGLPDSCCMIINLDHISYEICPKYPESTATPGHWDHLTGEYQRAERLPGNKPGNFSGSKNTIYMDHGVMVMSGIYGPIVPLNDKSLIISSGPFQGETMDYLIESGNIIHQNAVFVPLKRSDL